MLAQLPSANGPSICPENQNPVPSSFFGQAGTWFRVPTTWHTQTLSGQIWVTDQLGRIYLALTNEYYELVYQTLFPQCPALVPLTTVVVSGTNCFPFPVQVTAAQIFQYFTTDPTTDNVFPLDVTAPAMAYKATGTGAIYVWDPTNRVWNQQASGGNQTIFVYDGNPNGNVTATGPAFVIGTGSTKGDQWFKVTSATTNSDWFKVLST